MTNVQWKWSVGASSPLSMQGKAMENQGGKKTDETGQMVLKPFPRRDTQLCLGRPGGQDPANECRHKYFLNFVSLDSNLTLNKFFSIIKEKKYIPEYFLKFAPLGIS